ncbi:hypothetical protein BH11PSE11_BH11PSE11_27470 [soil metagenome]
MLEPPLKTPTGGPAAPGGAPVAARQELFPLPKFVMRLADGLHVSLLGLTAPTLFLNFIERIFSSSARFVDLDYDCMQRLLYFSDPGEIAKTAQVMQKAGKAPMLKLASDIVPFPIERQQLYHGVKLVDNNHSAAYMFEPAYIERVVDEPVPGSTATVKKTVSERATLDLDEFIAAMWTKYVRFGIDIPAVKSALHSDQSELAIVARLQLPTLGIDASIAELTASLHRDNAPKLLADGRVDLRQFQNRFPQVTKETKLIRKVPRIPGKAGWDIAGQQLVAEAPRDVDIELLAGYGTRIERAADGEFIVANMSGFLQFDSHTNSLSITEKIVNLEGVSTRTTGNLALSGDEYEEHGEVQERSQIEGKHMTFMADVFGNIISHGGKVILKHNLAAGSIKSPGGEISVEGSASRATLEAPGGEITLHYAESCLIIGKKVTIGHAIYCDILADEVAIEVSEGTAVGAQRIHVGSSSVRRDVETTISVLIPDLAAFGKQLDELTVKQNEAAAALSAKMQEIEALTSQKDMKNYSMLVGRVRAKEIKMTSEQAANWDKLEARVAPVLRHLRDLSEELQAMRSSHENVTAKIQAVKDEREKISADIGCRVDLVCGETLVRSLKVNPEEAALATLSARDLRARLRESDARNKILFSGSSGDFSWKYAEPGQS